MTMGLESLYRVFEWSLQKSSRLALIGIANALDLTDRFLPRLKSKNLKPDLLPFLPYTAAQVKNIITTRLKSLMPEAGKEGYVPFIHPAAIELCSRKVASQTGDLRRPLRYVAVHWT
ncbi:AAA ATPase [Metarhizium acridum]|nr:AAA ATPase [Metarhizium acridum]